MFDFVTATWLGVLGACVGSFLNVVAYRLPRGLSVVWKPSHCPRCEHPIRARDNVPVLGWLILRGRCRDCHTPISPRYAIVEALVGAIFFALAYVELFSAGANLPGGPFSDQNGALFTVWYPNWPLLGMFVYHATGASILTAMVLIAIDSTQIPLALAATALVVGGGAPAIAWAGSANPMATTLWLTEPAATLSSYLGYAAVKVMGALTAAAFFGRLVKQLDTRSLVVTAVTAVLFLPNDGWTLGLFAVVLTVMLFVAIAADRRARFSPGAVLVAWLVALLTPLAA